MIERHITPEDALQMEVDRALYGLSVVGTRGERIDPRTITPVWDKPEPCCVIPARWVTEQEIQETVNNQWKPSSVDEAFWSTYTRATFFVHGLELGEQLTAQTFPG